MPSAENSSKAAAKLSGRGAAENPANRFEKLTTELEPEALIDEDGERVLPRTIFLRDDSQSILTYNTSPDIPYHVGLNPYRGCEHGCAYCYARPSHEYAGFSAGLDFESRILVKERAPELLRAELSRKSWKPTSIGMSGVTDCYQPVERRLEITRRCLGVLAEFRNPVRMITKNHLITRDIDYLSELARFNAVSTVISVTTLDTELAKRLEPRASTPPRRLAAIRELSAAGIPVMAMMAPIIPGITDHEIPAVLAAAREAGAQDASYTVLRLPGAVGSIFDAWLNQHAPDKKEKVLGRLREMRGGEVNDPRFGKRMKGEGFFAEQIRSLFAVARRKAGFTESNEMELSTAAFRVPSDQMMLEF